MNPNIASVQTNEEGEKQVKWLMTCYLSYPSSTLHVQVIKQVLFYNFISSHDWIVCYYHITLSTEI